MGGRTNVFILLTGENVDANQVNLHRYRRRTGIFIQISAKHSSVYTERGADFYDLIRIYVKLCQNRFFFFFFASYVKAQKNVGMINNSISLITNVLGVLL